MEGGSSSLAFVAERIVALCEESASGITDAVIIADQPSTDAKQRAAALNLLLKEGRIEIVKRGKELIYRKKETSSTSTSKTRGFEAEERLVYQAIERSGNKGIWIRDIRVQCNVGVTQATRILKTLETKKLIKTVKSVAAARRKVYMLYDLEPDQSVTGGAWYSDQEFESEFVEILNQQCYKYLEQKKIRAGRAKLDAAATASMARASSKEIWQYITELGISKVKLSQQDIEMVLDTVVYDGKAEMSKKMDSQLGLVRLYCATGPLLPPAGLVRLPCGVCPVRNQCVEGGTISPQTCNYISDWLKF
ncbi:DNA-directed RNA polymerase III subunit RPC6-like [Oscarella lobularis]|uniref:DNA-directed RNA polymerase III subunit RPC6-like n=1 Tax=Oscarella lobularis TaxID=121494 RepID=UPI003313E902